MKEYIDREQAIRKIKWASCEEEAVIGVRKMPAADVVPIDAMFCEMMNWAARYAIGRRTYVVSDTANYILRLVDRLDWQTLICLKNDIESASSLGDSCDEKEWLKLLDAVKKELERRKKGTE